MSCIRFSLYLCLIFSINTYAQEKFTSNECLQASFETSIKQGKKFFGLIKSNLEIKKDKCIIKIQYKNIMEKEWVVDICRQPIHIKVTSTGTQSVYKRGEGVESTSEFLENWNELSDVIQDYGLIYAQGLREKLSSSHGMTYCTFLLVRKHLEDGVLFSTFEKTPDIYNQGGCSIVSKKEEKMLPVVEDKPSIMIEESPEPIKLEKVQEVEEERF